MAPTGAEAASSAEGTLFSAATKYLSLHAPHLDLSDSAVVCFRAVYDKPAPFTSLLLPSSQPAPFVYVDSNRGIAIAFFSVGQHLAGHPGILHGGASVALLDEVMGRAAVDRLPSRKVAVTAGLELKYKAPVYLSSDNGKDEGGHAHGTVVAVYAEVQHVSGRMAEVMGYVADIETGQKMVEGKGIFVEPRR